MGNLKSYNTTLVLLYNVSDMILNWLQLLKMTKSY